MLPAPPAPGRGTAEDDHDRCARALLSHLGGTTHPLLAALLRHLPAGQALASIRSGTLPPYIAGHEATDPPGLTRILARWRDQLATLPADGGLQAAAADGIRLICPGDPEWPTQLSDLNAQPCALWVRGPGHLDTWCTRAVAVVGSRAATDYGVHMALEIAMGLAAHGVTVISGAADGIDAAAHTAALCANGRTLAVLACGVDIAYPSHHAELLKTIASRGLLVSEYPPGTRPCRPAFLARNRIIAALSTGLAVIEAGPRSGTLNTVRHAGQIGRPVMAVPGPVTSAQSAGCHQLIRGRARLVTSAADILAELGI